MKVKWDLNKIGDTTDGMNKWHHQSCKNNLPDKKRMFSSTRFYFGENEKWLKTINYKFETILVHSKAPKSKISNPLSPLQKNPQILFLEPYPFTMEKKARRPVPNHQRRRKEDQDVVQ